MHTCGTNLGGRGVALALLVSGGLWGQERAALELPAFHVPKQHPRIFFTTDDVAQFHERMNGKPVAAGVSGWAAIRGHGFNYAVLGDRQSAERAINAALAMCRPGLGSNVNSHFESLLDIAICYDWCYAALSAETKSQLATALTEAMEKYDY